MRRTREYPLLCTPLLGKASTVSPGCTPWGSSEPRSAAPTLNPARS